MINKAIVGKTPETVLYRGGTETILLADDHTEIRNLMKEILTEFGYTVIEAVDGEDAVSKYIEYGDRIDLLLLDMFMPRKNGKNTYEEIRGKGSKAKAIFVSGYPADMVLRHGILEKECDLIMKPISPQNLLKKIREVLDRKDS